MPTEFIHLQCRSEYSVDSSLIRIPKLVNQVKKLGMSAISLTDRANLFAAVKFYKSAKSSGIKPIFGTEIVLDNEGKKSTLLLLCQNQQGYLNLSELISLSYLKGGGMEDASINLKQLIQYNQGLISIAPALNSDVAQALIENQIPQAKQQARLWQEIFGDRFYLGVQRTNRMQDEQQHLHLCVKLGLALDIPLVALNDVVFLKKDEFEAHEARICISQGGLLDDDRRKKYYSEEQYLKSVNEMSALFSDLPETIANTVEIAKRCNVHFELYKKNYLPDFPVPKGLSMAAFFSQESKLGLEKRLERLEVERRVYDERLAFELSVIVQMDFPGYFLIVADFIRWSKDNGIPVGPGRGSGAGSLVAYALGITNIDPIRHGLLFERFLNPERVSMPDFDVDFCTERRDEVIEYVSQKYGREKVSQIITYGTMAAKAVVRDVGRVLGHPYGFGDRISKTIPNDLKINLSRALGRFSKDDSQENKDKWLSEELANRYSSEESVTTLIDLSLQLEGLVRNVGTHAGGVLIAPSKISDFCPIYKASAEDGVVSQFDMKDVEALGLVKFDFLGLSNLTVINKTVKLIYAKGLSKELIDIDALPLDNKDVYDLLQRCDTTGIFQLESEGMRGYLKKLQADSFEDIVAMLALYRPGPLDAGMVDDYINVKHGKQRIKYPHPMLRDILEPTNGVFLYQEQVIKSAQVMAGYSLGGADLLRRAMGKKIAKEMDAQRDVFVKGAAKHDIDEVKANEIFDLIDKFSGYGFNKSHSVAYAYVSYQTAWLKAHYPAAFMACVLSSMMTDTDRISFIVGSTQAMGLKIKSPSINESIYEFSIQDDKMLTYGLGAIKGVGESLVEALVSERKKNGRYQDLFDFCMRIEKKILNKRALEALIYSGSLDEFKIDRAVLINTYPSAIRQAEQQQNDHSSGQNGLFANTPEYSSYALNYLPAPSFSFNQTLKFERKVMGYYFYNHPTDEYQRDLGYISAILPSDLVFRNNKEVRVLGLLSDVYYRNTKNGNTMASITLEDSKTTLNGIIFSKVLKAQIDEKHSISDVLMVDTVVVVCAKMEKDEYRDGWQLVVDKIENIDMVKEKYAKSFEILLNKQHLLLFEQLSKVLKQNQGKCPVRLHYQVDQSRGFALLDKCYYVNPNQQLIDQINTLLGPQSSYISY